jgi:type I restriction enzyme, S subunit
LMLIPLPDVVADLNDALTTMVGNALDQRARSLTLLEVAKRAVEVAIESGEAAALAYLAEREAADAPAA